MNKIEVKQKVIDILIDIGGINDKNQITNNTRLVEDLNFSSIHLIQLIVILEERFNVELPNAVLSVESLNTVDDIVNILYLLV